MNASRFEHDSWVVREEKRRRWTPWAICGGMAVGVLIFAALLLRGEGRERGPASEILPESEKMQAARPGECRSFSVEPEEGRTKRLFGTACLGNDGQWRLKP